MNAPGGGSIGQGGGGQLSGGTGSLVPGHNGHHYVQPQSLPYHMHHSLIQHLSDLRDLHGGQLPSAAAAAASTTVVTSPIPSVTATLPSVISVTQPSQTFVMASGGQLVATGGHLTPANIMTQGGSVTSAVDKLHKCPKCNVLLPSKNQLTQHKRKVHGKVAMAAATGGAIPSSHGSAITYAVVSSPQQPTTVQPSSSVVASLVSQVSQPVSVLAAAAAAAEGANSMFYYPTTSDLAMYGSSSYGNKAHIHSSRPKSKNRNTAGKNKKKSVTEGFGFLHAVF